MRLAGLFAVELTDGFDGMWIAGPTASGYAAHDIPEHR